MAFNTQINWSNFSPVQMTGENFRCLQKEVGLEVKDGEKIWKIKNGTAFVSLQRIVIVNVKRKNSNYEHLSYMENENLFQFNSFVIPMVNIKCESMKQPFFGSPYLQGEVDAVPSGGLQNHTAKFKIYFYNGFSDFFHSFIHLMGAIKQIQYNQRTQRQNMIHQQHQQHHQSLQSNLPQFQQQHHHQHHYQQPYSDNQTNISSFNIEPDNNPSAPQYEHLENEQIAYVNPYDESEILIPLNSPQEQQNEQKRTKN